MDESNKKPSLTTETATWFLPGSITPQSCERFEEAIRAARLASERAYAPYSQFFVGAAVIMDGTIFSGCNIENASYGATICAERTTISTGVAAGCRHIDLVAITTDNRNSIQIGNRAPCGICRQVISEFADPSVPILLDRGDDEHGRILTDILSLGDLLPYSFQLDRDS